MSIYKIPAPDAPAEEWGRLAVSLPGWRWMPGMITTTGNRVLDVSFTTPPYLVVSCNGGPVSRPTSTSAIPDPDDPATAGCLLELAGAPHRLLPTVEAWLSGKPVEGITSLGRAVIVDVRDQWGRWPGGEG